ncbi:HPr(Ser) kinase/phosphatase [bacterium]|nr:HPr(Ser) kinase/phosphatase [bacterium]
MSTARPTAGKSRPLITVRDLVAQFREELGIRVVAGERGLDRPIPVAEVNRPGLALTGSYHYFAKRRLQVLGKVEIHYVRHLPARARRRRIFHLLQLPIPAFTVTRNYVPPPELLEGGEKFGVPILRTHEITMRVVNKYSLWLQDQFAPSVLSHATLMEVHGVGILIMGRTGVGKSECALGLVERGHIFIADDVVKLKVTEGVHLTGYANPQLGHHMEIRGIGIINIQSLFGVKSVRMWKHIDFVVTLEAWQEGREYERLGIDRESIEILGVRLPNVIVPVKPGRDVALLIETAAQNEKLRMLGINVAAQFNKTLIAAMQ